MIAKSSAGTGQSMHLKCISDSDGVIGGDFLEEETATVFGHSGALHCDGIAAHQFNRPGRAELFTSYGPVTAYFDAAGNRLQTPEVRLQPTMAGPDGVATTIFRPFFGTSAAAPHVAAAAALMLEATGGPGTTTADAIRSALQQTTFVHDLDPDGSSATTKPFSGCTVTLSAHGDDSDAASADPNFFDLQFTGPAGSRLKSIAIDLSTAALRFDPTSTKGFPFMIGSASGGVTTDIRTALSPGILLSSNGRLTILFDQFPAGGELKFGLDRDFVSTHADGNSADFLARGILTANVLLSGSSKVVTKQALIVNRTGTGNTSVDGFGLINVNAAIRLLLSTITPP
jgi:hypothetical protein